MKKHTWILVLLAAGTLLDNGYSVYQFFFDPSRAGTSPFPIRIEGKYLTVDSAGEKDSSGPILPAGLQTNDRIIDVYNSGGKGFHISSLFDFGSALRNTRRDESWILVIQRFGGSQELGLILPRESAPKLQPNDHFLLIWMSVFLPILIAFSGFFIGFKRLDQTRAFLTCLLLLSFSTVLSAGRSVYSYPPGIREISLFLQVAETTLAGYFFLRLFLDFPFPSILEKKFPWLKKVALLFSVTLLAYALLLEFTKAISLAHYQFFSGSAALTQSILRWTTWMMLLTGVASFLANKIQAPTQDDNRRMTILLAGILCLIAIFVVHGTHTFSEFTGASLWLVGLAVVSGIFFPLSFGYAVLKYRVLGMNAIIRRGVQYLLASRGSYVIASALIFTALYLTVGAATFHLEVSTIPGFGWRLAAMAALAFGLAMTLPKISRFLMPYIDRKFFSRSYNSHRILSDLSRAIQKQPIKPELLIDLAISQINRALSVDRVAVFLRGAKVVDAPADADESQEFSISWIRKKAVDYQCCEIRIRSESETLRVISAEELQDFLLPFDSFVVKELQETIVDPRVLEVYWSDPRSWLNNLKVASSQNTETLDESILKRLNTRILVPMIFNKQLLGFLSLGEKPSEDPYPKEEKELLLKAAHQMAAAIDYALMSDRMAEQEKLRREIEIAKQVQGRLFPQRIPAMRTLDYTGVCKAAREVGGDYYDFLEIGPGRLGFVVADISGKGISAALLMASLQALLRSHAHLHGDRAELLVWDINRLMHSSTSNGKYASLFYGFYDDTSRLLAYVNAGHLPPILYRKDGSIDRLRTGGMVVGMMPDRDYKQEIIHLEPGDILLIFSDGITEAMNLKDQEFGEERLQNLISSLADLSAASIADAILKAIAEHVGTAPQHDDSTLLVIKAVPEGD